MKKQDELIEIRWHGRGGQGAVTASKILAEAAIREGKFIQAFPEYGPERMGAPIKSFTRISEIPIIIHSQVYNPQIAVVLDPTLLGVVDVCEGMPDEGILLINSQMEPSKIREEFSITGRRLFTVDATSIAIKTLGRNIPNTPMLGALVKATGLIKLDGLIEGFRQQYSKKFSSEIIEKNISAIKSAYEKVREG